MLFTATRANAIPSYARQTKLPCSACHTQFPELNNFGRAFKMNGYVLRAIDAIVDSTADGRESLSLNTFNAISIMAVASLTNLSKGLAGTQNNTVTLPDQLSVFLAGAITPKIGAFVQVTFDPQAGTMELDNTEFRYGTTATIAGQPANIGLSLNNNPTMSDPWNSTPVWGFPFLGSGTAPGPAAAAMIDGSLGQSVAGLSAFGFFNSHVYLEAGAYRSAPLGGALPIDASAENVVHGVAPYWRAAYVREAANHSLEVGTYGMSAGLYPTYVTGPTDHYTDLAADVQYQRMMGDRSLTLSGTFIHESQKLDATFAAGGAARASQSLNTLRARATLHVGYRYAFSLAPFVISGDADTLRYAANPVDGSLTGSPNSNGLVAEVDFMPWQNVRLSAQYTAYTKFNGGTTNYDGSGRNASQNNTLYLSAWMLY